MIERIDATRTLIRRLAGETQPVTRGRRHAPLLAFGIAGLLAFGQVLLLGVRPDLASALAGIGGQKIFAGAAMALCAAIACVEAARPDARAWLGAWLLAGLLAFAAPALLSEASAPTAASLLSDPAGPVCFTTIVAMALVPLAALLAGLRAGAPGSPLVAGIAAGALSGGLAACAYALHCTADTASIASFWYPAAVVASSLLGGLAGSRWLAW